MADNDPKEPFGRGRLTPEAAARIRERANEILRRGRAKEEPTEEVLALKAENEELREVIKALLRAFPIDEDLKPS